MATCIRMFEYVDETKDLTVKGSGWRLIDTPNFDPMAVAYGVVHDALEHHEAGEQGIEAEMMAFGSIYHIRLRGNWWDQFGTNVNASRMMAWDIARFLHEQNFKIQKSPSKPSKKLNDFFVDSLDYYLDHLEKLYGIGKSSPKRIEAILAYESACGWISKGYTRSLKRWQGNPPSALASLFVSLTSMIEKVNVTKHMTKLMVKFNTKTLEHDVSVLHTIV